MRPIRTFIFAGRCSIVDFYGTVICDIYARPEETIMDYRTRWSGLTKNHMKKAIPIQSALSQIANIIKVSPGGRLW